MKNLWSVSEFTQYVRHRLEGDDQLQQVRLRGEISNLTLHSSGHWYFSLKDSESQVSCVMFRSAQKGKRGYVPRHGDEVEATGSISVYPPRGSYQLVLSAMMPSGEGDLHQQFLILRNRLQAEGLFDPFHKKAIPEFPLKIGVITSPTGAVIRDILHTLRRRWPATELILIPAQVQGKEALPSLLKALEIMTTQVKPEVIIMGRGGGSLEDLWSFNEESLIREVFNCPIPFISAVGHETDFTLLDFVADLRAATPTAAAEVCTPNQSDLYRELSNLSQQLTHQLLQFTEYRRQRLDDLSDKLNQSIERVILQAKHTLLIYGTRLEELDIRTVLERGYSIVLKSGKKITSTEALNSGDRLSIYLASGSLDAEILKIHPESHEKIK
jgi:exodeoxyribonuclease VII large subunit